MALGHRWAGPEGAGPTQQEVRVPGAEGGGQDSSLVFTISMFLEPETSSENFKTMLNYCHNLSCLPVIITFQITYIFFQIILMSIQ